MSRWQSIDARLDESGMSFDTAAPSALEAAPRISEHQARRGGQLSGRRTDEQRQRDRRNKRAQRARHALLKGE